MFVKSVRIISHTRKELKMFREALEKLQNEFVEVSEQNTKRQQLLFEIYNMIDEVTDGKGNENDKVNTLYSIKNRIKESGNYLPF